MAGCCKTTQSTTQERPSNGWTWTRRKHWCEAPVAPWNTIATPSAPWYTIATPSAPWHTVATRVTLTHILTQRIKQEGRHVKHTVCDFSGVRVNSRARINQPWSMTKQQNRVRSSVHFAGQAGDYHVGPKGGCYRCRGERCSRCQSLSRGRTAASVLRTVRLCWYVQSDKYNSSHLNVLSCTH